MSVKTFRVIVSGKVQGVSYRATAKQYAIEHGIQGYAKNLLHGEVEIEATGTESQLVNFAQFLEQGPPHAHVETVAWDYVQLKDYKGFEVC
ncbi:acylphosphatase [Pseudoalteromonas ulvae UL12]|uniref:acylphosphatase n=1 Tax=Pseudoalteromonas ulvae TaxID=107327 RepID=A0A244CVJ6_PSEDV|nr:acylphosphatase [Pseudoalteromonas ulvae]MBE0362335.1 acylphosphatase [Pseudoalteromonas ulvae UL12]OUL59653.1 acylphosphatase [Pseudoalteromonas ulvae]